MRGHVLSHVCQLPSFSLNPNAQTPATPPAKSTFLVPRTFLLLLLQPHFLTTTRHTCLPPNFTHILPKPPKWVAFAPRPSRSPLRSSLRSSIQSSLWISRSTSVSAMRSLSLLPSACATRCVNASFRGAVKRAPREKDLRTVVPLIRI